MLPRLILRSLAARRTRAALAVLAVSLGIAVATALGTIALQAGDDVARTLRAAGPNFVVLPAGARWAPDLGGADVVPARAGATLETSAVATLKTTFWRNNVLEAAPELDMPARIGGDEATLTGTWFARAVRTADGGWTTGLARLRPAWRVDGRWPAEGSAEVALGRSLAARIGARPGDSVAVRAAGVTSRRLVAGVVRSGGLDDEAAWAPLEAVQAIAGRPGECDRVRLSALVLPAPRAAAPDPAKDPQGYEKYMCRAYPANVARELADHLPGAEVLPLSEVVAGEADVAGRLQRLLLLLALAALAASTLGLLSTTTATVAERATEFGLMRALGASQGDVALLLLAETGLVSIAGGAIGWALGAAAAALIRGSAFAATAGATPLLLPAALALATVVGGLGALVPLRVAMRVDPARVLHA